MTKNEYDEPIENIKEKIIPTTKVLIACMWCKALTESSVCADCANNQHET